MNKIKTMNWLKKAAAIGLTGLMMAPIAACGGGGAGTGNGGGTSTPPQEEKVREITLFQNDWEQFNNAKAVKSPIYKELVRAAGCDIKVQSTSLETYYSNLDIARSTGKLPEMFLIDGPVDPTTLQGLIRDKEVVAISDVVTEDKYPNLYNYMLDYDYMKSNLSYSEGKTWFIPRRWENEKSLYVRRDWVANINAKMGDILTQEGVEATAENIEKYKFDAEGPKTLGDFYRLARYFTLYDPDNNGKKDTYGYATEENRDMDSWMNVAFDGRWKMWTDEDGDGTYTNTNTADSSKYAASLLNKLISDGYTPSEVAGWDVGQKQSAFMNGKAGMMYAHNWYNVILAGMMSTSNITIPQARERVAIIDPPAGVNGRFGGQGEVRYYRGWCIKAGMSQKRLECCLDLLEYLYSEEGIQMVNWGKEGENWEWQNDDPSSGVRIPLQEADPQGFVQALRWSDPAAFAVYLSYEPRNAELMLTNGDILTARQTATGEAMVIADYPDVYTTTMVKYKSAAYNFYDEKVIKWSIDRKLEATWEYDAKTWLTDWATKMYSVSPAFQTEWDKYVKEYNDTYKGSQMQKEYNEAIASGKMVNVNKK